ncbi:hypothetical protein [Phascolarctobacterium faecium]
MASSAPQSTTKHLPQTGENENNSPPLKPRK